MKRLKDMSMPEVESSLNTWKTIKEVFLLIGGLMAGALMIKIIFSYLDVYDIVFFLASLNLIYLPILIEIRFKNALENKRSEYALKQHTR